MDNADIKSLIEAFESSGLTELEYSKNGVTLRLIKGDAPVRATPAPLALKRASPSRAATVTAPVFGVVHLRRTPADPPLVAVGQAVSAGQVLCLIEAMNVFTELRADRDGTIAAVPVGSGQALFRWA